MANKSRFGPIGPNLMRTYGTDVANPALAAGIAVIAGAAFNTVQLPGGANVRTLGVTALATVNPGDPVPVVEFGEVTAIADMAIARGQWVGVNAATGQLAPVGGGNMVGGELEIVGVALEAATQQGDEFLVFVLPHRMLDNTSSPTFASLFLTGLLNESALDAIVAHAGGGQALATPLTKEINRIGTVATAGDSVVLPPSAPGLTIVVINKGANAMQVFGSGADTINGVAAATGISQMASSVLLYVCTVAGSWDVEGAGTGYSGSLQTVSNTNGIVAHAGGGQALATPLTTMLNRITTVATIADSVVLPAAVPGLQIQVANAAANSCNVFPAGADQINALGASAAFALAGAKTAQFSCNSAGQWHSILSA
jgi:hypothetical protein